MEPLTMMLGYSLVQSAIHLVVKPVADRFTSGARQREVFDQMKYKVRLDQDVLRLNKAIDYENTINIQQYSHELRLKEANNQFEHQLEMWRTQRYDASVWPLRTPFTSPQLRSEWLPNQQVPIRIFLARTDPKSPYAQLLQEETKNRLSSFLQNAYRDNSHPMSCQIGDWKDGFQDDAFINALWASLKGQPTIVINPIQTYNGGNLDLRVSSWGLAEDGYSPTTQQLFSGNYSQSIGRIIRDETISWREAQLPIQTKELKANCDLLETESKILQEGGSPEIIQRLLSQYTLANEIRINVVDRLSSECANQQACAAGMCVDIFHLIEYGFAPRLPQAIALWNSNNETKFVIPKQVAEYYQKALTCMASSNYLQDRLPFLYIETAKTLAYDPQKAEEIFREGVGLWAYRKAGPDKDILIPETIDDCMRLVHDCADERDRDFVQNARNTLQSLDENNAVEDLGRIALSPPKTFWQPNEDVEFIKVKFSELDIVRDIIRERIVLAENASYYVFTVWNSAILIGTFTDRCFFPVKYENAAKNRFCVIYSGNDVSPGRDQPLYYLDFYNDKIGEMKSMDKSDKYTRKFEKLGKRMGEGLDSILEGIGGGDRQERSAMEQNEYIATKNFPERVVTWFLSKLQKGEISADPIEKMEMEIVLDWAKSCPDITGNQLFVVKGYSCELKKYLICVFFAQDNKPKLESGDYMKCFICKIINHEFEDIFQGNDMLLIPIE